MLHHIRGKLVEIRPTEAIIDCQGLGYLVHISLHTYSAISHEKDLSLFLYPIYKEDSQSLYGFASKQEREVFRQLISVSGVGANTARTILSSLSPAEVIAGIGREDVGLLKSVKGIGAKTAQRVIIDLKDKLAPLAEQVELSGHDPALKREATAALEVLGYTPRQTERVLAKLIQDSPQIDIEELIKSALKKL